MSSTDSKHKKIADANGKQPTKTASLSLPVNTVDAKAIVSAMLQTYPDGCEDLRNLFNMIDEGSAVEIDAIPDPLVRDSLHLLFQCLRLNFQDNSYILGDCTPNLAALFESIFQDAADHLKTNASAKIKPKRVIGPTMPPNLADDNDDDEEFGPRVSADGTPIMVRAEPRLMTEPDVKQSNRESWMTQLPENRTGVGIAHGLVARSFSRKGIRDVGDRSIWTETAPDLQRKKEKEKSDGDRVEKKRKMTSNSRVEKEKGPSKTIDNEEHRRPSLLDQYRANPQMHQPRSTDPTSVWDRERDLVRGTQVSFSNLKNIVTDARNMKSRFTKGSSML